MDHNAHRWQLQDCYRAPGPIQYAGPNAHEVNLTLQYENLPEAEVCLPIHTYVYMYMYIYVCMSLFKCVYICPYIRVYVSIEGCVYLSIHVYG